MQAEENNYQPNKQFTDQGWNEMLKTLDKEMPVQKKKRRGFFWLFPLLLIGMVASVWAFYPEKNKTETVQAQNLNHKNNQNHKVDLIQNVKEVDTEKLEIESSNIVFENKGKEKNENGDLYKHKSSDQNFDTNNKSNEVKYDDDFPSIINSDNPLSPKVIEEILPLEKTEKADKKEPLAKLENDVFPIDASFITLHLQKENKLEFEPKEFFFEKENEKKIVEKKKETKRKIEFGAFAGLVGDFVNIKKPGVMTGAFVHFPMGKKLGFRTGLGYSQLRKEMPFYFTGNQSAALSPDFLDLQLAVPPFSTVAVISNADFILKKFHHLDLPLLLTYSPAKKMQIHFGTNVSYLIKDKTELVDHNFNINNSVDENYSNYGVELDALDLNSISATQYVDENYWTKLNVSGVAGLVWKPTKRINLELHYHYGFLPVLKRTTNNSNNSNNSSTFSPIPTAQGFEVYYDPGTGVFNSGDLSEERSFFGKRFSGENFRKTNHSIRLSVGYNF